ncbi:MAG: RidA family protein [Bacteroidetes bacterium]|nr:RidA family protein [Rhodothermaceae bacterium RA]RMH63106.1 MAG: RidA family protein [Bacteroidota bacterium]
MSRRNDPPSDRTVIKTPLAPAAIGPYSQAILVRDTLYCSGQIPIDPESGSIVSGNIEAQTERVLENLGAVLRAAGMDYSHVVRCTVYLADINDYGQVNEVYARYFNERPPSREAVEVSALPRGVRVEISCIAVR